MALMKADIWVRYRAATKTRNTAMIWGDDPNEWQLIDVLIDIAHSTTDAATGAKVMALVARLLVEAGLPQLAELRAHTEPLEICNPDYWDQRASSADTRAARTSDLVGREAFEEAAKSYRPIANNKR